MAFDLNFVYTLSLLVIFLWSLINSLLLWQALRHYQKLIKGVSAGDLKKIFEEHLQRMELIKVDLTALNQQVKEMASADRQHLQKVGFVRFNPFAEVGSDQSFALALLDGLDDGLVISSLHGRDGTRLYAKPVAAAKEKGYSLSKEEKDAINQACHG